MEFTPFQEICFSGVEAPGPLLAATNADCPVRCCALDARQEVYLPAWHWHGGLAGLSAQKSEPQLMLEHLEPAGQRAE